MPRSILAVILGYAIWTATWLGGNSILSAEIQGAIDAGEHFSDKTQLAKVLGLSLVCSLLAGLATGAISNKRGAVLTLALLLLATGIAVQIAGWEYLPVWYHLSFLALLAPVTLVAGKWALRPQS